MCGLEGRSQNHSLLYTILTNLFTICINTLRFFHGLHSTRYRTIFCTHSLNHTPHNNATNTAFNAFTTLYITSNTVHNPSLLQRHTIEWLNESFLHSSIFLVFLSLGIAFGGIIFLPLTSPTTTSSQKFKVLCRFGEFHSHTAVVSVCMGQLWTLYLHPSFPPFYVSCSFKCNVSSHLQVNWTWFYISLA